MEKTKTITITVVDFGGGKVAINTTTAGGWALAEVVGTLEASKMQILRTWLGNNPEVDLR